MAHFALARRSGYSITHSPGINSKLLGYRSKAGFNGSIKNFGLLLLVRLCEFPSSLVHVLAHNYCIVLSELSEQQSSRENVSKWPCLRCDLRHRDLRAHASNALNGALCISSTKLGHD